MNWRIIVAIYLVIMNLMGFISMGVDKRKAIKHRWRIPEKYLFLFAFLGGSLGGIIGMRVFHHKTKHMKFVVGFSAILIVETVILVYFLA